MDIKAFALCVDTDDCGWLFQTNTTLSEKKLQGIRNLVCMFPAMCGNSVIESFVRLEIGSYHHCIISVGGVLTEFNSVTSTPQCSKLGNFRTDTSDSRSR